MENVKSLVEREKEALSKALQDLLKDMDLDNRILVAKKLKVSEKTVMRYLQGNCPDKTLAQRINEACRKNIIDREQQLSNHAA